MSWKQYQYTTLILALAALSPGPVSAQQIYQVGSGTQLSVSTGETPFGTHFEDNRNQFLIRVDELNQAGVFHGQIVSLAFDVAVTSAQAMQDFTISVKHTSDTSLATTFHSLASFTQVWNGTHTAHSSWNTFQFSHPFLWDGQRNLIIQTCFNNSTFTTNTAVRVANTSFTSNLYGYSDSQFPDPCAQHNLSGSSTARPNMRLGILSNTYNDAGIPGLTNPGPLCAGIQPIDVIVQNYGRNPITSVTVNWLYQGLLQQPVSFTGFIDTIGGQGPSYATVHLGNLNLVAGQTQLIAAWTSNPNGVPDTSNFNDTLVAMLKPALHGAYTIGGVGADYQSFTSAVADLNNSGICGPVVFDVRPGNYSEQIDITGIQGASDTNTVTFRAENGDSASVVLQYGSATFATNYVVQFTDARHVHFEKLTLLATDPFYGTVVRFNSGFIDSVSFSNCELRSSSGVSTSTTYTALLNNGASLRNFRFENNYVHHCSYGYYNLSGTDTLMVFRNNRVHPFYMGLRTGNSFSPVIEHNTIESNIYGPSTAFYGIFMSNAGGTPRVYANQINARTGAYGIYMSDVECSSTAPGLVANNMVHTGGNGTGVPYYLAGTITHLDVYHNTFNSTATGLTSRAMWVAASGTNLRLVNNIFSNEGTGYAFFSSGPSLISQSDYNCFFTTGINFVLWGTVVATLQALQVANGMDQNSLVADPGYFNSTEDLHCTSVILNDRGTPLPTVPFDIDGEPRHPVTPDIGADEFDPLSHDIALLNIAKPQVLGCGISDSTEVAILLANFGTMPQTGFEVAFRVYSLIVATETVIDTLHPGDSMLYTFAQKVDFSRPDIYPMSAWVNLATDQNRNNDTISFHPILTGNIVDVFPYIQTFELTPGQIPPGWVNDPFDMGEVWFFHNNSSSQNPQPNGIPSDHTTGNGHYAWVDNSVPNSQATNLLTPCFDFTQLANPHLEFYLWHPDHGNNIALHIDVWYNAQWHLDVVPPMLYQSSTNWTYKLVNLSAFSGGEARIRFRASESGASNQLDMAIDDIKVFDLGPINPGVVDIPKPVSGCGLTDFETVEIRVVQFGFSTLPSGTHIPVGFSVDGGQLHHEILVLQSPLGQFDTVNYTFQGVANVSAVAMHLVQAWTNLPQDDDPTNDTMQVNVSNGLISQFPYVQDFDSFKVAENATGYRHFWYTMPTNTQTHYRWNVANGPTPTPGTGPPGDYPIGSGNYLYTKGSSGLPGDEAFVFTPCFDITGLNNPGLNFHYHMFGSGIGSLHLDAYFNGGWILDIIPPIVGNRGNLWHFMPVPLIGFTSDKISFRFRARRGSSSAGDLAIDNVRIGEMPEVFLGDTLRGCGSLLLDAGNPGSTYHWTNGATTRTVYAIGSPSQVTIQLLGVTVTNTDGLSSYAEVLVLLEPGPHVDLGGHIVACDKDSILLDAGNVNVNYLWDNLSTSRYRFIKNPGTYYVRVFNTAGCVKSDTVVVDFGNFPEAAYGYTRGPNPQNVTFTSTSQHADWYLWDFGNGFTSTAKDPTHLFLDPDSMYQVTLIVGNICGSDTITYAVSTYPLGVDDQSIQLVEIFPNPATDGFTLRARLSKVHQNVDVALTDATGRIVNSARFANVQTLGTRIQISHLPAGIYVLRLSADGTATSHIVVKR